MSAKLSANNKMKKRKELMMECERSVQKRLL